MFVGMVIAVLICESVNLGSKSDAVLATSMFSPSAATLRLGGSNVTHRLNPFLLTEF